MNLNQIREKIQIILTENELPQDPTSFLLDQRKRYISENCLVVQPNSVESVQKVVRFCAENGVPITPQGGNTGLVGGSVAKSGILLIKFVPSILLTTPSRLMQVVCYKMFRQPRKKRDVFSP